MASQRQPFVVAANSNGTTAAKSSDPKPGTVGSVSQFLEDPIIQCLRKKKGEQPTELPICGMLPKCLSSAAGGPPTLAHGRCSGCKTWFCHGCELFHVANMRMVNLFGHVIVPASDLISFEAEEKMAAQLNCGSGAHADNMPASLFCRNCKLAFCFACSRGHDSAHRMCELPQFILECEHELEAAHSKLKQFKSEVAAKIPALVTLVRDAEARVDSKVEDIRALENFIKSEAERVCNALVNACCQEKAMVKSTAESAMAQTEHIGQQALSLEVINDATRKHGGRELTFYVGQKIANLMSDIERVFTSMDAATAGVGQPARKPLVVGERDFQALFDRLTSTAAHSDNALEAIAISPNKSPASNRPAEVRSGAAAIAPPLNVSGSGIVSGERAADPNRVSPSAQVEVGSLNDDSSHESADAHNSAGSVAPSLQQNTGAGAVGTPTVPKLRISNVTTEPKDDSAQGDKTPKGNESATKRSESARATAPPTGQAASGSGRKTLTSALANPPATPPLAPVAVRTPTPANVDKKSPASDTVPPKKRKQPEERVDSPQVSDFSTHEMTSNFAMHAVSSASLEPSVLIDAATSSAAEDAQEVERSESAASSKKKARKQSLGRKPAAAKKK